MTKNRDLSIDLLRVICCFLVVGIHAVPLHLWYINYDITETQKILSLLIQTLVRVGLPVFFVISGMYLLNSKDESTISFYKNRIPKLLIPFFLYSLIFSINSSLNSWNGDYKDLIKNYVVGLTSPVGISVHFWFVYSMFGIYLIAPLIKQLIKGVDENKALYVIFFLVSIKAFNVYLKPIIPFIDIPDLSTWLVYFIIGGLLPRIDITKRGWVIAMLAVGFLSTCALVFLQINMKLNINYPSYDAGANMYIYTIALCILFQSINVKFSRATNKIISFLSNNSYGVYLIHPLVLIYIGKYSNTSWYVGNIVSYSVYITFLTFFISNIISLIIDRLFVFRLLKALKR